MSNLTDSSNLLVTRLWREKARREPNDPHAWRMAHRLRAGRPLQDLHPLADIVRDLHPLVVVQKSAQVGATEALVDLALWAADRAYAGRGNVLFLMPTQGQMEDFAQARFDLAIQDSAYLRQRLQPEPPRRKGADRKGLKRLGNGQIFLRGAESPRQIASVDADLVVLDEYDQMPEGTLELARKRLASSSAGLLRVASTPRYPEAGINALFLQSDRRYYAIPCPACGVEQRLTWKENVDLERALVVCRKCRQPLNVRARGRWIASRPGNERIHGYQLNRLYSPWANLPEMIEASQATTISAVQEFHNSDLGVTYAPPGGGLSLADIDACREDYALADYAGQPCVMGVDVGLKLHVVVREHLAQRAGQKPPRPPRLWWVGEVASFGALGPLLGRYHVWLCAIDAHPETHKAREFALEHGDGVWLAQYSRHEPGLFEASRPQAGGPVVASVNRTEALDATFQRFHERALALPRDARALGGRLKDGVGEYYRELVVQKRVIERDGNGNLAARWRDHDKDDHYAHAELYALIAASYRPVVWGVVR